MDYNFTVAINQGEAEKPKAAPSAVATDRTPIHRQAEGPVLGFIVCKLSGQDFPITKNVTTIGSSEPQIIITYNAGTNCFFVEKSGKVSVAYIGKTPLSGSVELNAYDEIRADKLHVMFVPFCEGNRKWD